MGQFSEQSLAGSLLIDARVLPVIRPIVHPSDFASAPCEAIFRAACRLSDAGKAVDPVTIQADAAEHGQHLTTEFLVQLMELTPTAANAEQYARLVHENSIRRAVREFAANVSEQSVDKSISPGKLIGNTMEAIQKIDRGSKSAYISPEDIAMNFLNYRDRVEQSDGAAVSTGYRKLDGLLGGGMVQEGLYILAARPGVGKTTLGLKIADNVSRYKSVLFVSLEMSEEQLTARRIADRTGLPIGRVLLSNSVTEEERAKIAAAVSTIASVRMYYNRKPGATVADISLMARTIPDIGLLVIDYLGLIGSEEKHQSIYERVTANSSALKRLARSLGVPILCLAQLNRESEKRNDKRPNMADLRDSGAIEQDADGIMLLHRPYVYLPEKPPEYEGEPMEIFLVKNRHGKTGNVTMNFYGRNGRISE